MAAIYSHDAPPDASFAVAAAVAAFVGDERASGSSWESLETFTVIYKRIV